MITSFKSVPNPPKEYAFTVDGKKVTLGDLRDLLRRADVQNLPDRFTMVNSGHGTYTLRDPN